MCFNFFSLSDWSRKYVLLRISNNLQKYKWYLYRWIHTPNITKSFVQSILLSHSNKLHHTGVCDQTRTTWKESLSLSLLIWHQGLIWTTVADSFTVLLGIPPLTNSSSCELLSLKLEYCSQRRISTEFIASEKASPNGKGFVTVASTQAKHLSFMILQSCLPWGGITLLHGITVGLGLREGPPFPGWLW